MDNLLKDIRFGLRSLIKRPGFTTIAVVTLALGIGANTAIFSVVNATLLRPFPVSQPDRLVYVFNGPQGSVFSYPDYSEMRDANQVFDGMIAWGGISVSLNNDGQPNLVSGAIVTGNYFDVLGVKPALGRLISVEDDKTPGAHPVSVISYRLWQSRFAGDRNVIGKQLLLNGQTFSIVGVAPLEFPGTQMGIVRDLYVPMMMQATMRPPRAGYSGEKNPDLLNVRGNRWLFSIGRLKQGVSAEQAQAALTVIVKQQEATNPQTNKNRSAVVTAFVESDDPSLRRQLSSVATLLMSVVGVVLLIACANVANLLLARGAARKKEIALRLAIGATRWRIVRQLLTEGVLLASLGGIMAIGIAWLCAYGLRSVPPPAGALPLAPQSAIDTRVLLFTFSLSLIAGVVFALAPALRISQPQLVPALKDDSTMLSERRTIFNLRNLLVVTQVALSVVLLITAGLFLRSLRKAQLIEPGFDSNQVVTVPLNINLLRYTKPQGREFYRSVIERVEAIPGVESASVARVIGLSGSGSVRSLFIEGREAPDNQFRSDGAGPAVGDNSVNTNVIGLKYFQTMGIGVLRGRDFNLQDSEDRPRVTIVNESFARRHFGNDEPVGRRLSFTGASGPWLEIVGVVRDSKYLTLAEQPTPVAYVPLLQNHETGMTLHVRTNNPQVVATSIQREVQSLERNLPIESPVPLREWIVNSLYAARMGAILLIVFGALALLLASIGLYGVVSFAVSRRTRELGIRMALGAQTSDVFKLVLKQGFGLAMIGIVLGLAVAVGVTRLLTSFLYDVSTTDFATFISIPVLLTIVALLACYVPARRATRVDPLIALKYE